MQHLKWTATQRFHLKDCTGRGTTIENRRPEWMIQVGQVGSAGLHAREPHFVTPIRHLES